MVEFIPGCRFLLLHLPDPAVPIGSAMRNTVDSPGRLSHSTVPPWAARISRTMASPSPLPPSVVLPGTRKYLSKTMGRYSAGIPVPVSVTEKTTLPSAEWRSKRNSSTLGSVDEGVVEQILQGMLELVRIDGHRRQIAGHLQRQLDASIRSPGSKGLGRGLQQSQWPCGSQMELAPPLFQPCQIEQVVNHDQQPLGVVASIHEQFELFGNERPDGFLEQEMEHEPNARQRRLQFMTHRGHEIAFHLVEQAKTGDVLEQHGRTDRRAIRIADGKNAW